MAVKDDEFPLNSLARLDEQLSRPKWVVPVRAGDDLEILLKAAIKMCKAGEFLNGYAGVCEVHDMGALDGMMSTLVIMPFLLYITFTTYCALHVYSLWLFHNASYGIHLSGHIRINKHHA